jgi:hypothetical protein
VCREIIDSENYSSQKDSSGHPYFVIDEFVANFCCLLKFDHEKQITGSLTAALKQGSYTFLLGGIFMKGCENLATNIRNRTLAIITSVVIPSALTLVLTYTMHNFKGTPKPLESTIPTVLIIPATAVWGYRKRKYSEKSFDPLSPKGETS